METAEPLKSSPPGAEGAQVLSYLRFPSNGPVDRTFGVVMIEGGTAHSPGAGLAIIDLDNDCILCHGLTCNDEPPSIVSLKLACLMEMEWQAFARHIRAHPGYCAGISDIDAADKMPDCGNIAKQSAAGLKPEPIRDIRTQALIDIDANTDQPVRLPAISREDATLEILSHLTYDDKFNRYGWIAWDVRLNFPWNRTGRMRDKVRLRSDFDPHWRHMIDNEDDLIDKIATRASENIVGSRLSIFGQEDMWIQIKRVGNRNGFMILDKFCGINMKFTREDPLDARISRLPDDQLINLWAGMRQLNHRLSIPVRKTVLEQACHEVRAECEASLSDLDF